MRGSRRSAARPGTLRRRGALLRWARGGGAGRVRAGAAGAGGGRGRPRPGRASGAAKLARLSRGGCRGACRGGVEGLPDRIADPNRWGCRPGYPSTARSADMMAPGGDGVPRGAHLSARGAASSARGPVGGSSGAPTTAVGACRAGRPSGTGRAAPAAGAHLSARLIAQRPAAAAASVGNPDPAGRRGAGCHGHDRSGVARPTRPNCRHQPLALPARVPIRRANRGRDGPGATAFLAGAQMSARGAAILAPRPRQLSLGIR
jgi:hypothetical protein